MSRTMEAYAIRVVLFREEYIESESGDPAFVREESISDLAHCHVPDRASAEAEMEQIAEWLDNQYNSGEVPGFDDCEECESPTDRPCRHDWPKEEPTP